MGKMNRAKVIVIGAMMVAGAYGEALFETDFSDVLGDANYVAPKTGGFAAAKANPGSFYKRMDGVAFISDSHGKNWAPPPDTRGKGAARMGMADASNQLTLFQ